jgi:hypothetical protein
LIIPLLGILLFNWFGYGLLVSYLQDQTRQALEVRLDGNDYDESQLISIRMPVTQLSYYYSSGTFERVDGSVEIDGVKYTYVKRRLFNDSLELLCLADHAAMRLQAFNDDFFRIISGISTPAKRHGAHAVPVKIGTGDLYGFEEQGLTHQHPFVQFATGDRYCFRLSTFLHLAPERPPAAIG